MCSLSSVAQPEPTNHFIILRSYKIKRRCLKFPSRLIKYSSLLFVLVAFLCLFLGFSAAESKEVSGVHFTSPTPCFFSLVWVGTVQCSLTCFCVNLGLLLAVGNRRFFSFYTWDPVHLQVKTASDYFCKNFCILYIF